MAFGRKRYKPTDAEASRYEAQLYLDYMNDPKVIFDAMSEMSEEEQKELDGAGEHQIDKIKEKIIRRHLRPIVEEDMVNYHTDYDENKRAEIADKNSID